MSDAALNFRRIGERLRFRRLRFGLSTREVANRAGVARGTIVRLERGDPCLVANIDRVARSLCLHRDDLLLADPASEHFAVHRAEESRWQMSRARSDYQRRSEKSEEIHVNDAGERRRLGTLGFQPFYTSSLGSALPEGILKPALLELHRPTWTTRHYGEEFVYCLRGNVVVQIEDETCRLATGDSMAFDANRPHRYLPEPCGPSPGDAAEPPLLLCVTGFRLGCESLVVETANPEDPR